MTDDTEGFPSQDRQPWNLDDRSILTLLGVIDGSGTLARVRTVDPWV